jgi:hypothetical protein
MPVSDYEMVSKSKKTDLKAHCQGAGVEQSREHGA